MMGSAGPVADNWMTVDQSPFPKIVRSESSLIADPQMVILEALSTYLAAHPELGRLVYIHEENDGIAPILFFPTYTVYKEYSNGHHILETVTNHAVYYNPDEEWYEAYTPEQLQAIYHGYHAGETHITLPPL